MKNIIRKGIISSIALFSLAIVTSCDDALEEVIFSELTPENAFKTESDAVATINGIYEPLISVTNRSIFYLNDMPTDACYMKEMPTELWNERQMDNNQDVTASWRGYYRIISRANIALDKIPTIELIEFDDDATKAAVERDALLGEAYFMRALAYYNITDIFYSVPLVIDSKTPTDAILPPTPIADIEKQIESDLLAAKKVLPKSFASKSDAGRATLGAAAGYLCRLHMRIAGRNRLDGKDASANWNSALGYANEVLALEGENIYSLQAHVWDIFDPTNDASKYNNELIFSIRSNPSGGGGTSDIGMNFTPWEYDCGWNLFSVPLQLMWKYDKADERYRDLLVDSYANVYNKDKRLQFYRIPESIDELGLVYNEENKGTETPDDDVITYEMGASFTQKYKYEHPLTYNYKTGNNMPMMRLADIILCKAEILNELNGPTQDVINLLNRIRERAFQNANHNYKLADYGTKDAMRELICDERLLELNNEGVRRPDLIRMGFWKKNMDEYVAFIKLMSEKREENAVKKQDQDNPAGAPHKRPDYSAEWKVYPADLTETDIRRYYPAPKREMDLNPDLKDCRNF